MPPRIHPLAHVEAGAQVDDDAEIGPYCFVGADVSIAAGCRLLAHVYVSGDTSIGARTVVHPHAALGGPPQSLNYRGGRTKLVIGADCKIREGVTMNTGTEDGGGVTRVGDHCFVMIGSHVGHDCTVGNHVIFANNVLLGGHVEVGDKVVFGGAVAVRQFVRIGERAMIVGLSGVRADVIPFAIASGPLARVVGLNVVGLRRSGVLRKELLDLRRAYRALFFGEGVFRDRIDRIAGEFAGDALVARLIAFVRAGDTSRLTMAVEGDEQDEPDDGAD